MARCLSRELAATACFGSSHDWTVALGENSEAKGYAVLDARPATGKVTIDASDRVHVFIAEPYVQSSAIMEAIHDAAGDRGALHRCGHPALPHRSRWRTDLRFCVGRIALAARWRASRVGKSSDERPAARVRSRSWLNTST